MPENRQTDDQRIISVFSLLEWADSFLIDRKAGGLSPNTIIFYRKKLQKFIEFCRLNQIHEVQELDAKHIRQYLLWLDEKHHNQGGIHAHYRVLRTFLYWYEQENELINWSNPIRRVKVKLPREEPLEPADIEAVKAMINICGDDFTGVRDKLIFLMLLDTGMRASEILALDIINVNPISGILQILHGKGNKFRTAYLGKKTKMALRSYLNKRGNHTGALFIGIHGERLAYDGLRMLLKRRSEKGGVLFQSPHSFRRLFALEMLRNGIDVFSLQLLMGHEDLQMLRRYLKLVNSDMRDAHLKASPVDRWKL